MVDEYNPSRMMNTVVNKSQKCRICNSEHMNTVISLGEQYITSRFPIYGDFSTPKTQIHLSLCSECGLLQLEETVNPSELYEYEYGYRSGISHTMRAHLKQYQEEIVSWVTLNPGDVVVDIGSNDSTLLQLYSTDLKRIGIDPTGNQFESYYGDVELIPTYFTVDEFRKVYQTEKCKVVSSISMFYDLPNPVQFAKDIYEILDEDGIWTCEQSYMPTMLKSNSIDTICHEHLEYYALTQIKRIADMANFKIIDVTLNECNGGSFRVYFAKQGSTRFVEHTEKIQSWLKEEDELGIMREDTYRRFIENCDKEIDKLCYFVRDILPSNHKTMYVYGASTKGNCLLQYANLGEQCMKYAVERNPNKIGKMTCTGIEIISEETMRQQPPNYLLVLPWHFKREIIEREDEFLTNGGQLVFPFPHFEIVSKKPRVLITGCDGMIASYMKERCTEEYTLYGIARKRFSTEDPECTVDAAMTRVLMDMTHTDKLEKIIQMIHPTIIIHLAGISSAYRAFLNPIDTLDVNGMTTAHICDIIHRHGLTTRLFNASSSEIYKGHVDYDVNDEDENTHMFHPHPYSIAKIMGHTMVDFYRNTYQFPFSNGIIFTTESIRKRPEFLINKVKLHAAKWKHTKEPLVLGNLDSYRNIIHASDVANAIYTIVNQPTGANYCICNTQSVKMYDIVVKIYENMGIMLDTKDEASNVLTEQITHLPVVILQESPVGSDTQPVHIRGYPNKLLKLGWSPIMTLDDILREE